MASLDARRVPKMYTFEGGEKVRENDDPAKVANMRPDKPYKSVGKRYGNSYKGVAWRDTPSKGE